VGDFIKEIDTDSNNIYVQLFEKMQSDMEYGNPLEDLGPFYDNFDEGKGYLSKAIKIKLFDKICKIFGLSYIDKSND
jgi:hypothetical protein